MAHIGSQFEGICHKEPQRKWGPWSHGLPGLINAWVRHWGALLPHTGTELQNEIIVPLTSSALLLIRWPGNSPLLPHSGGNIPRLGRHILYQLCGHWVNAAPLSAYSYPIKYIRWQGSLHHLLHLHSFTLNTHCSWLTFWEHAHYWITKISRIKTTWISC